MIFGNGGDGGAKCVVRLNGGISLVGGINATVFNPLNGEPNRG
jgi:hypothetical protein